MYNGVCWLKNLSLVRRNEMSKLVSGLVVVMMAVICGLVGYGWYVGLLSDELVVMGMKVVVGLFVGLVVGWMIEKVIGWMLDDGKGVMLGVMIVGIIWLVLVSKGWL